MSTPHRHPPAAEASPAPELVHDPVRPPPVVPCPRRPSNEAPGFFDRPEALRPLRRAFLGVLLLLILSDLAVHHHAVLGPERVPGFHAGFSLLACLLLFAVAKASAAFLKRGDAYYD